MYARVSNASRHHTVLEYQANSIVECCSANGRAVDRVVKEVGGGVNAQQPKLNGLSMPEEPVRRIVPEHRGWLARFGYRTR